MAAKKRTPKTAMGTRAAGVPSLYPISSSFLAKAASGQHSRWGPCNKESDNSLNDLSCDERIGEQYPEKQHYHRNVYS